LLWRRFSVVLTESVAVVCSVYVNGKELARVNMPATIPTFNTLATARVDGAAELTPVVIPVPNTFILNGANTIAVEVRACVCRRIVRPFIKTVVSSPLRIDCDWQCLHRYIKTQRETRTADST
jgi:hypothetical protein